MPKLPLPFYKNNRERD